MFTLNETVHRHSLNLLKEMLSESPIVGINGARQVGKSTLAGELARSTDAVSVTLDNPATADFAKRDPRTFLEQAGNRMLVIDEFQRVPELILPLKMLVDENRRPGRFLVTGSANFLNLPGTGDSLAGRMEDIVLRPLSVGEISKRTTPEDWVDWILSGAPGDSDSEAPQTVRERIVSGGYPLPLQRESSLSRRRWFKGYIDGILAKDATILSSGDFPRLLPQLLNRLAVGGIQELVRAKLARFLNTSERSLETYLQLAQTMYLTESLPSWGIGISGRVVRKPKIMLLDSGLSAALAGVSVEQTALVGGWEFFGALCEQFVALELKKQQTWSAREYRLFHFRQRDKEVDIVIELADGRLILVEVKSGQSVPAEAWNKMRLALPDERVTARVVLYLGDQVQKRSDQDFLLPVSSLWTHPK